eukprot:COSAG02_NODE_1555_length_11948_cov_28.444932_9_plen_136_part_00
MPMRILVKNWPCLLSESATQGTCDFGVSVGGRNRHKKSYIGTIGRALLVVTQYTATLNIVFLGTPRMGKKYLFCPGQKIMIVCKAMCTVVASRLPRCPHVVNFNTRAYATQLNIELRVHTSTWPAPSAGCSPSNV